MFEHRKQPLLPRRDSVHRLGWSLAVGAGLISFSLAPGMPGFHPLAGLTRVDAFLDASMILSGMRPLLPLPNDTAKLFVGCYAIDCGIAFIGICGVILAPVTHRFLHPFHLEWDERN